MTKIEWLFSLTQLFLMAAAIGALRFVWGAISFAVWGDPVRAMVPPMLASVGFYTAYEVALLLYTRAIRKERRGSV